MRRRHRAATAQFPAASPMPDPQLPPTRERAGAPSPRPDNTPSKPGRARIPRHRRRRRRSRPRRGPGHRAARKTYANVPRPPPSSTGSSRAWRTAAPTDAPYSYDEAVEEGGTLRPAAAAPALAPDREPKRRARTGAVFPVQEARSRSASSDLVGAGNPVGQVLGDRRHRSVQATAFGGGSAKGCSPLSKPKIPRSRRPALVDRAARAGGAARRAV